MQKFNWNIFLDVKQIVEICVCVCVGGDINFCPRAWFQ